MLRTECYMCSEDADSREHVPPRNLFPESKDVGGRNFRSNLITVPSCSAHNSGKSSDDEFLMVSLAGIIGNNSIGYSHKFGKVDRAIKRSSGRLLEKVLIKNRQIQTIKLESNNFINVIWGTPDIARLNKCFEHIARGLYFHHFQLRFNGEVRINVGYLKLDNPLKANFQSFLYDRLELDLAGKPILGDNKDIFYYQLTDPDKFGLISIKMCFYGGLNVFAALIPTGVALPPNPVTDLMKAGIKTIITLGDKKYEVS